MFLKIFFNINKNIFYLWKFIFRISDHDGKGKSQEGDENEKRKNILLNLWDNYVNFRIFLICMGLFIAAISSVYFFGIFLASSSESLSNKTLTGTITITVRRSTVHFETQKQTIQWITSRMQPKLLLQILLPIYLYLSDAWLYFQ